MSLFWLTKTCLTAPPITLGETKKKSKNVYLYFVMNLLGFHLFQVYFLLAASLTENLLERCI